MCNVMEKVSKFDKKSFFSSISRAANNEYPMRIYIGNKFGTKTWFLWVQLKSVSINELLSKGKARCFFIVSD